MCVVIVQIHRDPSSISTGSKVTILQYLISNIIPLGLMIVAAATTLGCLLKIHYKVGHSLYHCPSQILCRRSGSRILQAVSVFISKRPIRAPDVNRDAKRRQMCLSLATPKSDSIWSQCVVTKMSFLIASSPPTLFKIGIGGGVQ